MMPRRPRTRDQERAARVTAERQANQQARCHYPIREQQTNAATQTRHRLVAVHPEHPPQCDESHRGRHQVGHHQHRQFELLADRRVETMQGQQGSTGDGESEREDQQSVYLMSRNSTPSTHSNVNARLAVVLAMAVNSNATRFAACAPIAAWSTRYSSA